MAGNLVQRGDCSWNGCIRRHDFFGTLGKGRAAGIRRIPRRNGSIWVIHCFA